MLQQHALVCTVEGQQLHEAQVAQLIAATMAEECLSCVVHEFDSWYCISQIPCHQISISCFLTCRQV